MPGRFGLGGLASDAVVAPGGDDRAGVDLPRAATQLAALERPALVGPHELTALCPDTRVELDAELRQTARVDPDAEQLARRIERAKALLELLAQRPPAAAHI